jgi:hypothetical protein
MTLSELLKTPQIEALNDFLDLNTGSNLWEYIRFLGEAERNPQDFDYPLTIYPEIGTLTEE